MAVCCCPFTLELRFFLQQHPEQHTHRVGSRWRHQLGDDAKAMQTVLVAIDNEERVSITGYAGQVSCTVFQPTHTCFSLRDLYTIMLTWIHLSAQALPWLHHAAVRSPMAFWPGRWSAGGSWPVPALEMESAMRILHLGSWQSKGLLYYEVVKQGLHKVFIHQSLSVWHTASEECLNCLHATSLQAVISNINPNPNSRTLIIWGCVGCTFIYDIIILLIPIYMVLPRTYIMHIPSSCIQGFAGVKRAGL